MPPQNLRIPGPTPLPDAVREAGSRQMVAHRGPEFKTLVRRVSEGMQPAFDTTQAVMLVTSSGTGGLESAVVSFLSPGDAVLAVSIGNFGERFAAIASAYGADVTRLDIDWGDAARPEDVTAAIVAMQAEQRTPVAVLLTFNETSTGVTNPLPELGSAIRAAVPDALIVVDGISGIGAMPFHMDAWDLDVVVTGSQKAWMIPPGLAMAAASDRAWAAAERATMPRFYFDLVKHRDALPKGQTPWTPAVGLFLQLDAALTLMEAEGLEGIFARHAACAAAARAGVTAMGFELFADPRYASASVTSIKVPEGVDWPAFNKELKLRGLVLAGGQGKLSGRIFRIGHLGEVSVSDIVSAIDVLEQGATAIGIDIAPGVGPTAARSAGNAATADTPVAAATAGA